MVFTIMRQKVKISFLFLLINDKIALRGAKNMSNDLDKALKPIKKGFSFIFHTLGEATPYLVNILFLPVHGVNYLIQKAFNKTNPYNGAKITKVSDFLGEQLAKIPYGIEKEIKRL